MSLVSLAESGSLVIEGQISLNRLMEYRRELDELLPGEGSFSVDLSRLQSEDSSILALLVYLVRQTRAKGAQVSFTGASDHLTDMADLAGLATLIALDTADV